MVKNENLRWILLGAAVILFLSMQNVVPKEAVVDVRGQLCTKDKHCPCWGKYNETKVTGLEAGFATEAYGIGVSRCILCTEKQIYEFVEEDGTYTNINSTTTKDNSKYNIVCKDSAVNEKRCDTSLCFDIEPVGDWARQNPLNWLHDNPLLAALFAGLILLVIFWPK